MNYTLIRQREVQQGFFSQHQVTLFTIHLTIGQEHRNLAIISDYMEHTTSFVHCAQKLLVQYVKKNFPLVKKINYVRCVSTLSFRDIYIDCFSDGASAHFKNNSSMLNLVHHKGDFGLEACWTFAATGHGKGAGDGVGAVLKSTARRATLSKNFLLSTAKDFYTFSYKQQMETARSSDKIIPGIEVLFLDAKEVEQVKKTVLQVRSEQLRSSGKKIFFFDPTSIISI